MSRAPQRLKTIRHFSSTVFSQVLISAANFAVGLLLIRNVPDADYGYYVLATTTLLLFTGVQSSFINSPLAVLAPQRDADGKHHLIEGVYASLRRFWLRAALSAALLLLVLWARGVIAVEMLGLGLTFVLAAAATLRRDFLRQSLLLYARPQALPKADALYVGILVAGITAVAYDGGDAAAGSMAAIALAAAIAGIWMSRELRPETTWPQAEIASALRQILPLGAWATAGAVIYWCYSQGFYYLIALRMDVADVATVAAVRLLLMPVNVLGAGVGPLLLPTAARWLREQGFDSMLRRLMGVTLVIALLALIYILMLWVLRDVLVATLMKKAFADLDVLIVLWALIISLSVIRSLLMTTLLVCERFQALTWLALGCALVSLSLSLWGIEHAGVRGALIGILVGELLNLAGVIWLGWRERSRRA